MDKISFLGSENELSRVPFGSILKETREKTKIIKHDCGKRRHAFIVCDKWNFS